MLISLAGVRDRQPQLAIRHVCLLMIVILGAAVRFHCLGDLGLWYDEAFSWRMTNFPLSEQCLRSGLDNHPPLYFVLLKLWADAFGNSAESLRSLSVVFGLLTIVGVYLFIRDMEVLTLKDPGQHALADSVALFAAGLVALSPFQIEWSQTVRMYSVGTAFAAWSSWALVRAVYAPASRWRDWLLFAAFATGLIYTHYYGLFILGAHVLFAGAVILYRWLWVRGDAVEWRRFTCQCAVAFGLIGLLWWPWFGQFLLQRERAISHGWTQPFSIEHIANSFYLLFDLMWVKTIPTPRAAWTVTGIVAATSLGILLFGRRAERLLGWLVLVTVVLAIASSYSGKLSVLGARYFVFAHVFMLCTFAVWLYRLFPLRFAGMLSIIILGLSSWQTFHHVQSREERSAQPSFRAAMAYIESQREPDEPICVGRPRVLITCSPYLIHQEQIFVLAPSPNFPFNDGTAVLVDRDYVTSRHIAGLQVKRIWVLDSAWIKVAMPPEWVDVSEERFNDWTWGELTVRQYERRDALRRARQSRPAVSALPEK